jgi:biopolymer transport protein ExbD
MTPLIDVIFLLLTFFIYSLVMTVQAQIMPVRLTAMTSDSATQPGSETSPTVNAIHAITITRDGQFHYNQQKLTREDLPEKLKAYAALTPRPRLFIAVEAQGDLDRGPLLIHLLEQLHIAGIDDFAIVGQPPSGDAAQPSTPSTTRPVTPQQDTPNQPG